MFVNQEEKLKGEIADSSHLAPQDEGRVSPDFRNPIKSQRGERIEWTNSYGFLGFNRMSR